MVSPVNQMKLGDGQSIYGVGGWQQASSLQNVAPRSLLTTVFGLRTAILVPENPCVQGTLQPKLPIYITMVLDWVGFCPKSAPTFATLPSQMVV
jgi:hypothetical protein